ncbi:NAD(P)H-binding protein [Flavobacterium sp. P21]|uniref:NAD(P)H-binding protein n=1 Tax=Flavobacterium sp. P21 TaxID=3423948 RepID=UPI003D674088
MKAVVIGATGSTGGFLVDELLADKDYSKVTIFVRRPSGKQHDKLAEHIIDFSSIESRNKLIVGDVIFSCLGTTLKDAGSKKNQWKIDYDIPVTFARLARENGIFSFVLLSSFDASVESSIFYSVMKGEIEESISEMNFEQYIVFKPGILLRDGSNRLGEKIIVSTLKLFNSIGLLEKYSPMPTSLLAEKLAKAPKVLPTGTSVIKLDRIFNFVANI